MKPQNRIATLMIAISLLAGCQTNTGPNEQSGVVIGAVESDSGPCREYTIDAIIGGKTEQIYGTACRQSDGSWKTVS